MTDIRPIPTPYGGVKFRSRTEARWALFFDRLRIPWEYEPQGFDIGDGQAYLPDFILGLGDLVMCHQCGEKRDPYPHPPWDDDKRISEAYSAALSARFGTG